MMQHRQLFQNPLIFNKQKCFDYLTYLESELQNNYHLTRAQRQVKMKDYVQHFSACIFTPRMVDCISRHIRMATNLDRQYILNLYDHNGYLAYLLERFCEVEHLATIGELHSLRFPSTSTLFTKDKEKCVGGGGETVFEQIAVEHIRSNVILLTWPPDDEAEIILQKFRTKQIASSPKKKVIYIGDIHDIPGNLPRNMLLSELAENWKCIDSCLTCNDFGLCIFGHEVRVFECK